MDRTPEEQAAAFRHRPMHRNAEGFLVPDDEQDRACRVHGHEDCDECASADWHAVALDFQRVMFREQKRCEQARALLANWLADDDTKAGPLGELEGQTREWLGEQ